MNKIKYYALAAFLIFTISFYTNAQEKVVTGVVTTLEEIPLIGAKITVKKTKAEAYTDITGVFSIECNPNDVLIVSADGFYNQKVKIGQNVKYAAVNLKLKPGERNYNLGYGYVADKDKLNAVAGLNQDDMDFSQYSSLLEAIRGRFAGVEVTNDGRVIIRGLNSLYGDSAALIVVDGVITDNSVLKQLPPSQVKRIDIIKDSGAAIYGSRGGSGVVLIETKKGLD